MARIAFVQDVWMEYVGTMYLASVLKLAGNIVEIFIGAETNKLIESISRFDPDIVGFSCMTGQHEYAVKMAQCIKLKTKAFTVFGGPHPTFFPDIIEEKSVDIICRGEGEGAVIDLARAVDCKADIDKIPNCWVKRGTLIIRNDVRNLIADLDSLPFPDRSLYYQKYPFMNNSKKVFMAGRGCPYRCSYCFNGSLQDMYKQKGKYVRFRSVNNVILEIEEVCKKYKTKTVQMADDTFITDKAWLHDFLEKYKKTINLPLICLVRADLITEDIVSQLKAANCYSVFFGVESGIEYIRSVVLGKSITNKQIIEAAKLLRKYKIKFRTYNMLGLPEETIEQAFKTVEFNADIKVDYPWCSILQPYPGTIIRNYAERKKLIQKNNNANFAKYFFKNSILDITDAKEISNLQKLFYWAVKFPLLMPFIRYAIKLPANIIFDMVFLIGYAYSYYKSERLTTWEVFQIGRRNVSSFFAS
jgi:anaerobic magnesium-protoporphyrin IX monomethyl ester cyclase